MHIVDFLEICDTLKFNGVSDDAVRLRLFPFSLRDKAKHWLNSLPVGSITTWEDLAKAFLIKYFPPSKTMKLPADITTFSQFEQESLYEAWERFKDLLRRCPHDELPLGLVVQTFYYGLLTPNRTMIDAAACGNLSRKTAKEGYELLEEMAASNYHPHSERNNQRRSARVHEVTDISAITAQLDVLNRKLDGLNMGGTTMRLQEIFCEKSGGEHYIKDCQDSCPFYVKERVPVNQVRVQNRPKNDPYSNTYNPGWRQHPNFSWGVQNSQNRPQGGQPYGKQQMNRSDPPREEKSNLEQMMSKFISATETRLQNQDASIKGLENQIGQLAKMMASRESGTLPSNTETNPKGQVNSIELMSEKTLEPREGAVDTSTGKSSNSTLAPTAQFKIVIPPPFPAALKKAKLDAQFGKFLELFRKLHINIPFADALMQMPSYAKFLKDILANKRNLKDHMTRNLTENCSAIVQNKIPPKVKDSGSFSILCMISGVVFHKALCDLGTRINLIPLSVCKKLGLGEPKRTKISLQLADRSVKYPRGVIEDVLVKVGKFMLPTDFVVLDMEEDREMPLILRRPFLSTGKAVIDVQEGKLRFRVGEEEITLNVFNALKHTLHTNDCFIVNSLDSLVCHFVQDAINDPLEATLTTKLKEDELKEDKAERAAYFSDNHPWKKSVR
ncbi:uncharacterized protein [Primulina huaijiensis]|uniref:uncharacterized protein n=1 Tax=Primulina huaijiensis TaxID=1492673 RepID=UPI003CC7158F